MFAIKARTRAYTSVKWVDKNLTLLWTSSTMVSPSVPGKTWHGLDCNQAVPAEPMMISALEEAIVLAYETKDP